MSEQEVAQLVAHVFREFGAEKSVAVPHTLFLDGGRCLAIAYHAKDLSAVWCCEDEILEFRNGNGQVLRTLSLGKGLGPSSVAARRRTFRRSVSPKSPSVGRAPALRSQPPVHRQAYKRYPELPNAKIRSTREGLSRKSAKPQSRKKRT